MIILLTKKSYSVKMILKNQIDIYFDYIKSSEGMNYEKNDRGECNQKYIFLHDTYISRKYFSTDVQYC